MSPVSVMAAITDLGLTKSRMIGQRRITNQEEAKGYSCYFSFGEQSYLLLCSGNLIRSKLLQKTVFTIPHLSEAVLIVLVLFWLCSRDNEA